MNHRLVRPRNATWGVMAFSVWLAGCGAGQSGEGGEMPAPEVAVAVVTAGDLPIRLERPRSKRDEGFDQLVESIFERIV